MRLGGGVAGRLWQQAQLIPFMALANGRSEIRVGVPPACFPSTARNETRFTHTNIWAICPLGQNINTPTRYHPRGIFFRLNSRARGADYIWEGGFFF